MCVCIYEGHAVTVCISERILYQDKLYLDVLKSSSSMKTAC